MDQFLQRLKTLAKDCNFRPVTADQYREELIRDAFISGLESNLIRQRLLEQRILDLQTAFDQARSLELAQLHSQKYQVPSIVSCATNKNNESFEISNELSNDFSHSCSFSARSCFFCGYTLHPRSKCPAREAFCKSCGKKAISKKFVNLVVVQNNLPPPHHRCCHP